MAAAEGIRGPRLVARLAGLGSVFGKGIRDSRWVFLPIGLVIGFIMAATAAQVAAQFDSLVERKLFAAQLQALPPIFQGLLGEPIRIETLGGFLSWRVGNFLPVMLGVWSIVALSGTLAGELARGTLEFVAATPVPRWRIALEKAAAHLAGLTIAVAIGGGLIYLAVAAFATLPGDDVSFEAVLGYSAWLVLVTLVSGAIAFAAGPFLGRAAATGLGVVALFGSFIVNGYADIIPTLDAIRPLSFFALTAGHRPLAGSWDWPPVIALASICLAALAVGVYGFARRDLVVPSGGPLSLPRFRFGVDGPLGRSFAERLPAAIAWGLGLGGFGWMIGFSADEFVRLASSVPQITEMIRRIYPGADIVSAAGFLQLSFFSFTVLMAGIAAATFVSGWASDEAERRLEVVLGAPLSRLRWGLSSGLGVLLAIAVMAVMTSTGVALGVAGAGDDPGGPFVGTLVVGMYAGALAGIGLAVGGLVRAEVAAVVVGLLAIGFYLLDLIGSILRLPEQVLDVALNRHLGRPIIGAWDELGLLLLGILIVGGLALGALGLRRRDIGR